MLGTVSFSLMFSTVTSGPHIWQASSANRLHLESCLHVKQILNLKGNIRRLQWNQGSALRVIMTDIIPTDVTQIKLPNNSRDFMSVILGRGGLRRLIPFFFFLSSLNKDRIVSMLVHLNASYLC